MSKSLANLLNQPERLVTRAINKLEDLNGYPSQDCRLLAANNQEVRQKIADLGLDPDDTTGEELYQALIAKFAHDCALLDKALGINASSSAEQRAAKAHDLVQQMLQADVVWVLRPNAAKKLLHQQPPKRLMKQLNYRSIDSMLRRENIAELYLGLAYLESSSWQRALAKAASQLPSSSYELRAPVIVTLQPKLAESINSGSTSSNYLIGASETTPPKDLTAPVLTLSMNLLDSLEALTHTKATGSFADINPSLLWWEQAKDLIAECQGETVSLNYKDVAQDHLRQQSYAKRSLNVAQASLWERLASSYHRQEAELIETVEIAEAKLPKPAAKNLAVEYAEAIAHEF